MAYGAPNCEGQLVVDKNWKYACCENSPFLAASTWLIYKPDWKFILSPTKTCKRQQRSTLTGAEVETEGSSLEGRSPDRSFTPNEVDGYIRRCVEGPMLSWEVMRV
jgi:hypothetical protein